MRESDEVMLPRGSMSSLSGDGIPSGAKSPAEYPEAAIRTVAAATLYVGSTNLSGRARFRMCSSSTALARGKIGFNKDDPDPEVEGAELALLSVRMDRELEVCESELLSPRGTMGIAREEYLPPGDELADAGVREGDEMVSTGGSGILWGSKLPAA